MAQSWRLARREPGAKGRPLDASGLERLTLHYVERYATTRAKLAAYLQRKLRDRGWEGDQPPNVAAVVERMAELGYVDDRSFATARAAGLTRRGYGPRRVAQALTLAGVGAEDAEPARAQAASDAWPAAIAFARRRRLGPFASVQPDRAGRAKALATMLRAGHALAMARVLVESQPGTVPTWDED